MLGGCRTVIKAVFPALRRRARLHHLARATLLAACATPLLAPAAHGHAYGGPNSGSRIGANVSVPVYYDHSLAFVDMMRQANGFNLPDTPWVDPSTTAHGPIALTADGWPTEDFGTIIASGWSNETRVQGVYTVVFRGHATVIPVASPGVTVGAQITDAASGLTRVPVTFGPTATQLMLAFKQTDGSVRDLRVLRPGYAWDDPNLPVYADDYRRYMAPFSTLRTMDWTATNSVKSGLWADRVTPELVRGGKAPNRGADMPTGAAWEQVIQMANELDKDVWINVPTKADDDYVTQLATLFKAQLEPSRKLYVEWGNEMWNGSFPQGGWLTDVAVPAAIAAGNTHLEQSSTNKYVQAQHLFAERTFRIGEILRTVFGDDQMMTRVRPVLAWQSGGHSVTDRMIRYAHEAFPDRPVNDYIWAFSGAPYFGLRATRNVDGLPMADLAADMTTEVGNLYRGFFYEYSAYLKLKYGLHWVAYEGGPDTFGSASLPAKTELNRSSTMGDLCRTALTDWDRAGGELFMWYFAGAGSWTTQYGAWSTSETIDLANPSHKMRCLTDVSAARPALPVARHISGVPIDAAESVGMYPTVGDAAWVNERKWWAKDQVKTYMVSSDQAVTTCYPFATTGVFSSAAGRFTVSVNGAVQQADRPIVNTTGTTPVRSDMGEICLDPGMNAVELKMTTPATGNLDQLIITDEGRQLPPPPSAGGGGGAQTTTPTTPAGSSTSGSNLGTAPRLTLADPQRCVRGAARIPALLTAASSSAVRLLTVSVAGRTVAKISSPSTGIVRLPATVTKALRRSKARRPSLRAVLLMRDGTRVVQRLTPRLAGRTCTP